MTGYRVVNLTMMIEELGEGEAKRILSNFPCPLNPDVEFLISKKSDRVCKTGVGINASCLCFLQE